MAEGTGRGEMNDAGLTMEVVGIDGGETGVAFVESPSESCVVVP